VDGAEATFCGSVAETSLPQQLHGGGVRFRFLVSAYQVSADLLQHARVDLAPRANLGGKLL
jgi:hypothetical protein